MDLPAITSKSYDLPLDGDGHLIILPISTCLHGFDFGGIWPRPVKNHVNWSMVGVFVSLVACCDSQFQNPSLMYGLWCMGS